MARKEKTKSALATLSDTDREEYVRRQAYFNSKQMEAMAAGLLLDHFGELLRLKYDLPDKYDLNLQTGVVTERKEEDAKADRGNGASDHR